MSDQIPEVAMVGARRSVWDRVSVVWLVPVAAFLISVGVAWQSYADRGPLITIYFDNTAGVAAGETELRFRDVAVGTVEAVSFTEDLSQVAVSVRVDKEVGAFIDAEAEFWIVRPEVTTQGVSGLDTVLSGVYLEGQWDRDAGGQTYEFEGLQVPPLLQGSAQGLEFMLRSTSGTLAGNTPILYKGVEVGTIGPSEISADGVSVEAQAVIYAPYDNLVTEVTRFWDTSGFSITLGTAGAAVDFESIASLIAGGISFDTFVGGAPLAEPGAEFLVYEDEAEARQSVFEPDDSESILFSALFDGNVAGLNPGAGVELNGLRIGQVRSVNGIVSETPSGASGVQLLTVLAIQPARIGLEGADAQDRAMRFFQEQVADGSLRARLVTASILTGGLKVELLPELNVARREIDMDFVPHPLIPTTASEIADVQASAQDTLQRINALPIEELMNGATGFLNAASELIGSAETQQLPAEVNLLLAEVRDVVGSESVQDLPRQIGAIMTEIEATVGDVRGILVAVEEQQIVANVGLALEAVAEISDDARTALQGVPGLVAEIETLAATAADLPLDALVADVSTLAASANALLASEAAQGLPGRIDLLMQDVQAVAADAALLSASLSDAQAAERLTVALDTATATLAAIDSAMVGVPGLLTEVERLAGRAADLPLERLVAEVTDLSEAAGALIAAEATQALPAQAGAVAEELRGTLAEVRAISASLVEQNASARVLSALEAAESSLETVNIAFAGVPELIADIDAVVDTIGALPLDAMVGEVTDVSEGLARLVAADATQALPGQVSEAAAALTRVLNEVDLLASDLNAAQVAAELSRAVSAAADALAVVDETVAGVPELIAEIDGLVGNVRALPLDQLVAEATGVSVGLAELVAQDATQALPGQVSAAAASLTRTLDEVNILAAELNAANIGAELAATINAAASALETIDSSVAGLPQLIDDISAVAAEANALNLAQLSARAEGILTSAEALIAAEGTQALPAELNAALSEIRRLLAEFREGGAVGNLNAALISARTATDEIAAAAESIPELLTRANRLLAQADTTLSGFEDTSPAIRDARAALADISRAAEAVASLARAIERRPNSLLTGR